MTEKKPLCDVCKNQNALYLVVAFHRTSHTPCTSQKACSGCFDRIEALHQEQKRPECPVHHVEVGLSKTRV